ncbi:MAG: hypothetical protein HQL82_03495 [Magnetococcales bacterium]|nr:hypothetical protein [Magnetococcales bacterium]
MNNHIARTSLLALAGAVAVGASACGGGGGSTTTTSSGSSGTLGGIAAKAPITITTSTGTVTYNGSTQSGTTVTAGSYSLAVTLPTSGTVYKLVFSSGIDSLTSTTQIMDLTTLVTSASSTVNANAITSMISYVAMARAGGTSATISDANATGAQSVIVNNFSFGADAVNTTSFDPITTAVSGLTSAVVAAEYALALEAAGEFLRRIDAADSTRSITTVLTDLGTELADDNLDADSSANATLINAAMLAGADVINEVIARTLTVSSTGIAASLIDNAFSTALGSSSAFSDVATALSGTTSSTKLFSSTVTLYYAAGAYLTAIGETGTTFSNAAAALAGATGFSLLNAQNNTVAATKVASAALTTAMGVNSTTALLYAASAYAASAKGNTFMVNGSSSAGNQPKLVDYVSNVATTLSPDTPSLSSGVLTISMPTATTINSTNLTKLTTGDTGNASPPIFTYQLTNLPSGSGTAAVTLLLKDGSSITRSSSQRQMAATFPIAWSSDGTYLTLTTQASSTAAVTYYTSGTTSASSVNLSNTAVDGLIVSTSGSTQSGIKAELQGRIAYLFNTTHTLGAALNSPSTQGQYFYQIVFSGFPLGWDLNGDADIADSNEGTFTTIQGTFIVQ